MAICPALHYMRLRVIYMAAAAQRRGDRRVFILRPPRLSVSAVIVFYAIQLIDLLKFQMASLWLY